MKIAYDGSKFYGFQRLNEELSVQKVLEDALSKINKKPVVIRGAGRTDRGVHALGQHVSFNLDVKISSSGLKKALNSLVEPYIYVRDVKELTKDLSVRYDVVKKIYKYKINLGEFNPIMVDYVYQCKYNLDLEKMKDVAKLFIGVHDFHNFVSGERKDYTCVIYDIGFIMQNDILEITFEGKSFYRYMVRNLVGAMIEVGRGKVDISYVEKMLNTKGKMTIYTALACGLYLEDIKY